MLGLLENLSHLPFLVTLLCLPLLVAVDSEHVDTGVELEDGGDYDDTRHLDNKDEDEEEFEDEELEDGEDYDDMAALITKIRMRTIFLWMTLATSITKSSSRFCTTSPSCFWLLPTKWK